MRFSAIARRGIPALVAISTVGYVFLRVPFSQAWSAAAEARIEIFAPVVFATVLLCFWLESLAYARLFSRFNTELSWREARALRGLSYLLTPIHLSLGKVGIVLGLSASRKVAPLEVASTVALYQTLDAIVLAGLATIGLSIVPTTAFTDEVRIGAIAIGLALTTYLLLVRFEWTPSERLRRVRSWTIHRTHRMVGWRDLILILAIKLTYQLAFVAVFYIGARAFGFALPLGVTIAATPIIHAIGAIPISPAGLGTQHAAMLVLFSPFGLDASIVAFGFTLTVTLLVARLGLGLFYLPSFTLQGGERSGQGKARVPRFVRRYFREEIASTSNGHEFPWR